MTFDDFYSKLGFYPSPTLDRIIRFNVTRQWYDLYASGTKREEYRKIKPFWEQRLCKKVGELLFPKEFDYVVIRCGYGENPQTPDLIFKWESTSMGDAKEGIGRELIGARTCYVVKMGDIE